MNMFRVDFRFWKSGCGYSHSETVDRIVEGISAEDYITNRLENAESYLVNYDGINVELYNDNDELVEEYFWEKED